MNRFQSRRQECLCHERFAFLRGAMYSILRYIELTTGEWMPRYLSQHTLACLTRQGAEQLSKKFFGAPASAVTTKRVLVNMQEGKMLVELDAPSREELEKWFDLEKFHYDWLLRLEWESGSDGSLHSL